MIRIKKSLQFLILSVLIFFFSCYEKKDIRIGMLVSLTGKFSSLSISGRNGAVLAAEIINKDSKGFSIELAIEDDESSPETAKKKIEKLKNQGINMLLSINVSSIFIKIYDYINENKIFTLSPTIASEYFSGRDDYFFRMSAVMSENAKNLAILILEKKLSKIAVIYDADNIEYSQTISKAFIKSIKEKNNLAQFESIEFFSLKQPSYKDLGRKLIQYSPEAVLIIGGPLDTAMIAQQIAGKKYLIMVTPWGISDELIKNGGSAVEGLLFYQPFDTESMKPASLEFAEKYSKRFGVPPTGLSYNSYDAVYALYKAIKNAQKFDADKIKDEFIKMGSFRGIQSEYRFDRFGDCISNEYLYMIKDAKFVKVK